MQAVVLCVIPQIFLSLDELHVHLQEVLRQQEEALQVQINILASQTAGVIKEVTDNEGRVQCWCEAALLRLEGLHHVLYDSIWEGQKKEKSRHLVPASFDDDLNSKRREESLMNLTSVHERKQRLLAEHAKLACR
jgi:hypothetical protein